MTARAVMRGVLGWAPLVTVAAVWATVTVGSVVGVVGVVAWAIR